MRDQISDPLLSVDDGDFVLIGIGQADGDGPHSAYLVNPVYTSPEIAYLRRWWVANPSSRDYTPHLALWVRTCHELSTRGFVAVTYEADRCLPRTQEVATANHEWQANALGDSTVISGGEILELQ